VFWLSKFQSINYLLIKWWKIRRCFKKSSENAEHVAIYEIKIVWQYWVCVSSRVGWLVEMKVRIYVFLPWNSYPRTDSRIKKDFCFFGWKMRDCGMLLRVVGKKGEMKILHKSIPQTYSLCIMTPTQENLYIFSIYSSQKENERLSMRESRITRMRRNLKQFYFHSTFFLLAFLCLYLVPMEILSSKACISSLELNTNKTWKYWVSNLS
jgi:hypothetical protein